MVAHGIRGLFLSLAAAAAWAADYAQEVRQDKPVAWWRFQDAACSDGAVAQDDTGAHPGTYRGLDAQRVAAHRKAAGREPRVFVAPAKRDARALPASSRTETRAGWVKHPANPVIAPGLNQWDHDACYKPYAIFDGKKWLLWYNGRRGSVEQIGLARHEGEDLGFDAAATRIP